MKGRESKVDGRDQQTEKQLECHPIISSFHGILSQGDGTGKGKITALLLSQDSKLRVGMKDGIEKGASEARNTSSEQSASMTTN